MGAAEDVHEPATEYLEIYVSEDPDDYEAIAGEEIY
jgi:hypothetical protein